MLQLWDDNMYDLFENRNYRNFDSSSTTPFRVTIGQSDLFVRADRDLTEIARDALLTARYQIETYIQTNVVFDISLEPLELDRFAPPICQRMLRAGLAAGVGPFAAVAGAVAQAVGEKLAESSTQVVVENGGDLYLKLTQDLVVGLHAGDSPLSGKVGLRIAAADTPASLCTSSGTFGHSYSAGQADGVTIFAKDASLADAAATAVANRVATADDVDEALAFAETIEGVLGVCIIVGEKLGIWGNLTLENLATDKE
jgi:uncharacterized protein